MKNASDLRNLLMRIDHRGYPAYKDTKDKYQFDQYVLSIDHVQGDPFASPSKVSVIVPGRTTALAADRRRVGANLSAAAHARQTGKNRRCLSGQTGPDRSARAQALPAHASDRSHRRSGGGRTAPCVDAQERAAPLSSVRGMDGVGIRPSREARAARAILSSASSWVRSRLVSRQWASSARSSAMWSMSDMSCSSRRVKTRARTGSCRAGSGSRQRPAEPASGGAEMRQHFGGTARP